MSFSSNTLTAENQINALMAQLLTAYTDRHQKYRQYWSAAKRPEGLYQEAEQTQATVAQAISNLVNGIKQNENLTEQESKDFVSALWRLEDGMSHTSERCWNTTLEDIQLVCKRPKFAKIVADALVWLKETRLANDNNIKLLTNASEDQLNNFAILNKVDFGSEFSLFDDSKEIKFPTELKQHVLNRIINSWNDEIEEKSFTSSMPTPKNILDSINEKTYRVKLTDLQTVMNIYNDLKEIDKQNVLRREMITHWAYTYANEKMTYTEEKASTNLPEKELHEVIKKLTDLCKTKASSDNDDKAENLFSDKKTSPTHLINVKDLYFMTRVLCAGIMPHFKTYMFFGGPPEGWKKPEPTKEEIARDKKDKENHKLAQNLMDNMFGKERALALRPLWKKGNFDPVFELNYVFGLFQVDKKLAFDYTAAIDVLWEKDYNYWQASQEDINFVCQYLQNQTQQPASFNDGKKLLKSNLDTNYDSYSGKSIHDPDNKHPVVKLANGLLWLGEHGIETVKNKKTVYQFANHLAPLLLMHNYVSSYEKLYSDETRQFYQKVFTFVIEGINQQLQAKNTLTSNKSTLFPQTALQAESKTSPTHSTAPTHK